MPENPRNSFSQPARKALQQALPDHNSAAPKRAHDVVVRTGRKQEALTVHAALELKSGRERLSSYISRLWQAFPPLDATEEEHRNATHFRHILTRLISKNVLARGISDDYIAQQRRIAEDEGRELPSDTAETRTQLLEILRADQLGQFTRWTTYLEEEYLKGTYPDWFVVYVMAGIVKMGQQATTGKVKTVDRLPYPATTTDGAARGQDLRTLRSVPAYDGELPFVELNAEALARVKVAAEHGATEPFHTLYPEALKDCPTITPAMRAVTTGMWTKFSKGQGKELSTHVQGSRWCTAGEGTAATQLDGGEFLVFSTPWETWQGGQVPRIAIRMQGDRISEIRGIAYEKGNQVLEEELFGELEAMTSNPSHPAYDKRIAKDFPSWKQRVDDMRHLTTLHRDWEKNTKKALPPSWDTDTDALCFLYQTNRKIVGFGYGQDERINTILKTRNIKKDFALALCSGDDSRVSEFPEKILSRTVAYIGNLHLHPEDSLDNLRFVYQQDHFAPAIILEGLTFSEKTAQRLIDTNFAYIVGNDILKFPNLSTATLLSLILPP